MFKNLGGCDFNCLIKVLIKYHKGNWNIKALNLLHTGVCLKQVDLLLLLFIKKLLKVRIHLRLQIPYIDRKHKRFSLISVINHLVALFYSRHAELRTFCGSWEGFGPKHCKKKTSSYKKKNIIFSEYLQ